MEDWSHTHIKNNLRRCTRCTLPETHETILFDEEGICNICRGHEIKNKIDWNKRREDLHQLADEYRGKGDYDCMVPFSGGKDSAYILWYVVKKLNLKPLVVSFDHGFYRPILKENNERVQRKLGVDFLKFRSDWKLVRRLMLESLKRKGDFDWHAHVGTFAYPMQMAVKYKIPLIFWGEPSSEYTAYYGYDKHEEIDERRNERLNNLGITAEDMAGFLGDDVSLRDFSPYIFPKNNELREIKCKSVPLGEFVPWNVKEHYKIINQELGWEGAPVEGVPPEFPWEKIEYQLQGPRDYLKFIKRGYSRVTHLTSIEIWNNRMTREDAAKLIESYEGKRPASLDFILKIIGISEDKWNEIALTQSIPPYKHDFSKTEKAEPLEDMEKWEWNPC
jgi:N-acetyl sugar amidotransferase